MNEIDDRLDMALVWGPYTELIRKQVRFVLPTGRTKKSWVPPPPVASDFQYVPREAYMKALEPLIRLLADAMVKDILKQRGSDDLGMTHSLLNDRSVICHNKDYM